jgi:hypothetical protein
MDLNWIQANYNKMTPEEKWLASKKFCGGPGGFSPLLWASPVKTESYKPPDEDIPPSPYIPLAHR